MSTLNINLNLDNDAFADDASAEVARILRKLADTVEGAHPLDTFTLRDINGNVAGQALFTWDEQVDETDAYERQLCRNLAFAKRLHYQDLKRVLQVMCGIEVFDGEKAPVLRYALANHMMDGTVTEEMICAAFDGKY